LPAPESTGVTYRAPRTQAESILCELVATLVRLPRVGLDDNFFRLGGDSILSIQLVSRARREGLALTPRDVFEYQTLEALARAARPVAATAEPRQDAVGPVPLTPIMRALLPDGPPAPFSQVMVVKVPAAATAAQLQAAWQAVLDTHDALRLRVVTGANGDWSLEVAPPGAVAAAACFTTVAMTGLDAAARRAARTTASRAAVDRLAPPAGILTQVVWFPAAASAPAELLLVVHHLAVDAVSWQILLPDLQAAWEAAQRGESTTLVRARTAFRRWAERLTTAATQAERVAEVAYWQAVQRDTVPLVEDTLVAPRARATITEHWQQTLPAHVVQPLLTSVPAAFHGGMNDVLLGALAVAVGRWQQRPGVATGAVLVALESHGREHSWPDVDVTRTVGWFTSSYPVRLDVGGEADERAAAPGTGRGPRLWPAALSEFGDRRRVGRTHAATGLQLPRTRGWRRSGGLARPTRPDGIRRHRTPAVDGRRHQRRGARGARGRRARRAVDLGVGVDRGGRRSRTGRRVGRGAHDARRADDRRCARRPDAVGLVGRRHPPTRDRRTGPPLSAPAGHPAAGAAPRRPVVPRAV
jgi:aryl carrier-like protein